MIPRILLLILTLLASLLLLGIEEHLLAEVLVLAH